MFTKTVDYRLTRQGVVEAPPEGELPSYLFDRAVRNLTDVEGLLYQFKIRCVGDAARIVGGASLRVAGVGGGILQLGRIAADETASSLVSVGRRQEEGTGWQRYRYEWIEGREGKPRAACIWGSMDIDLGEDGLRKRIIEAHQRGEIQVLINYGILTEGYDDPTIEAIIVARPTKSRALYTQMIGRGLRPDPAHPERMECLIIDVTGRKVKHKLDVDCAHLFGVEQTTDGAEPMDVFAAAQRADQLMKNSSLRERIRRRLVRETDGAVEYEEFDLLGEVVMPLRVSLREALSSHFDGDETQVAWRLGIQETRLGQYLSGHIDDLPERVEEVERDFARSEEVLEIPTDRVVELWREAKRDWNINLLFETARTLDQADKGETLLPLPIFLNALALRSAAVKGSMPASSGRSLQNRGATRSVLPTLRRCVDRFLNLTEWTRKAKRTSPPFSTDVSRSRRRRPTRSFLSTCWIVRSPSTKEEG